MAQRVETLGGVWRSGGKKRREGWDFADDVDAAEVIRLRTNNPPEGTQSYAVVMHHIPGPGDTHWYMVLYDIPADTDHLDENVSGVGTWGTNSVNPELAYTPHCSKGPGLKWYTLTVYALSAAPELSVPPADVDRDTLLAALSDRTLASAELN